MSRRAAPRWRRRWRRRSRDVFLSRQVAAIKRLEDRRDIVGECPRCNGRGWPQHFVQGPPECDLTTRPGDRIGCDRCGRVSHPRLVILDKAAPNPLEQWLAAGGTFVTS
ncbi:MAG: hypothetical protein KF912_06495 [Phycisphaeraceae bacterium]|nr:hypothetical protein [Phycisphaeraceae bacterium]QYK49755.1 MAG: hypothetical protein KF838_07845 [Phycisphaeraceae bacterium]